MSTFQSKSLAFSPPNWFVMEKRKENCSDCWWQLWIDGKIDCASDNGKWNIWQAWSRGICCSTTTFIAILCERACCWFPGNWICPSNVSASSVHSTMSVALCGDKTSPPLPWWPLIRMLVGAMVVHKLSNLVLHGAASCLGRADSDAQQPFASFPSRTMSLFMLHERQETFTQTSSSPLRFTLGFSSVHLVTRQRGWVIRKRDH